MKTSAFLYGLLAATGLAACGGGGGGGTGGEGGGTTTGTTTETTTGSGGGGTAGTGGAGTAGAGGGVGGMGGSGGGTAGSGGSGGTEVQCTGEKPVFPAFDKTCAAAADCALVFHQINCCGTRVALGISSAESAAFGAAEATCEAQYPGCGCAQQPTVAEDGKSADESLIQVDCLSGSCGSFVP
jgi:hypothetical protein